MKLTPTQFAKMFVSLSHGMEAKDLSGLSARFWRYVFKQRKFGWRRQIMSEVERLWQEAHGVRSVRVAVAHAMSESEQHKLSKKLAEAFGTPVELEFEHKPHLLAGAVLTCDDKRYDASLKGRLDALYRTLAKSER